MGSTRVAFCMFKGQLGIACQVPGEKGALFTPVNAGQRVDEADFELVDVPGQPAADLGPELEELRKRVGAVEGAVSRIPAPSVPPSPSVPASPSDAG